MTDDDQFGFCKSILADGDGKKETTLGLGLRCGAGLVSFKSFAASIQLPLFFFVHLSLTPSNAGYERPLKSWNRGSVP